MSIADTNKARLYANRAEVAAAQCQIYTEEARRAPEYTNLAKQYAEIAEESADAAVTAAQTAQQSSNSASSDASNAIQAANDAESSRDSAATSASAASDSATNAENSADSAQSSADSASADAATAAAAVSKTIRVGDTDISPIPDVSSRANKVLSFDASGNPIATTPASGSATDVLNELAAPGGVSLVNGAVAESDLSAPSAPSMIGVMPQGNLSQLLIYVTPEQFGAIGDGTAHPLSERYSTLAAAQAVYPFVTALTQTIDWASCQAAENYARGKTVVKCPWFAKYHFGSTDYLKLGIDSKWQGARSPMTDLVCSTMIRLNPAGTVAFGQDCIVRVMDATEAGSSDEFTRGVVFEGIKLTRNLPRRSDVRGTNGIGLHLNFGMKAVVDVTVNGCDFGVLGYGCWGSTGTVRIDSCHKGIYLNGWKSTPEITGNGTLTSLDWRVEIDACVFPITLDHMTYAKFTGFYEGLLDTYTDLYKKDIETACGITLGNDCSNVDFFLGIEAFQGTHLTMGSNNNVTINNYYLNDRAYNSTSGINGAFAQIDGLMSRSTPQIASGSRAFFFAHGTNNTVTVMNPGYFGGNITDDPGYIRYLYNMAAGSQLVCVAGFVSSGTLFALTRARFDIFRQIGTRNIMTDYFPANYTHIGNGVAVSTNWALTPVGADGRATLTAPPGYKIIDFTVHTVIGTAAQATSAAPIGVVSTSDTSIVVQTPQQATGFSVTYKLTIQVTK